MARRGLIRDVKNALESTQQIPDALVAELLQAYREEKQGAKCWRHAAQYKTQLIRQFNEERAAARSLITRAVPLLETQSSFLAGQCEDFLVQYYHYPYGEPR